MTRKFSKCGICVKSNLNTLNLPNHCIFQSEINLSLIWGENGLLLSLSVVRGNMFTV